MIILKVADCTKTGSSLYKTAVFLNFNNTFYSYFSYIQIKSQHDPVSKSEQSTSIAAINNIVTRFD